MMDKSVFEAWAREKGFDTQRSESGFTTYEDIATEMYWECWKAALRSKNQEIGKIANLKAQVNALKDENAGLRAYIENKKNGCPFCDGKGHVFVGSYEEIRRCRWCNGTGKSQTSTKGT